MEVKSVSLMEYNELTKHINPQECQKNLYNMGHVPMEEDKRFMEIFEQRNKTQEKSSKIGGVFISTICTALIFINVTGICKDIKMLEGNSAADFIFEIFIIVVSAAILISFFRRIRKDNEFFRNLNTSACRISRPQIYGIHIDGDSESHVKTVIFDNCLGCTDLLYDSRYNKKNKTYYFDDYRVVSYMKDGKYRSHCILLYNDEN